MYHGLIISGTNVEYPVEFGRRSVPSRSPGAHKIASHLRKTGEWDVEVLDFTDAFSLEELKDFIDSRVRSNTKFVASSIFYNLTIIRDGEPSVPQITQKQNRIMKYAKDKYPWIHTVAGSQKLMNLIFSEADYHVVGAGEKGMEALCDYFTGKTPEPKIHRKRNPFNVVDIEYYDREYNIVHATRDYPAFPMKQVRTVYEERDYIQPNETLTVELSRGCIFKCPFCTFEPLGIKGDYARDPEDYRIELLENYERWGVTNYIVSDETGNDRTDALKMFAEVTNTLPFRPQIHGFLRADLLVSRGKEDWDYLIDIGYTSQSYGLESFNHESAKSVKKGMHPDKLQDGLLEAFEYFDKNSHGYFSASATMIAGLPFETFESLDRTEAWLNKYWKYYIAIHPLYLVNYAGQDGVDAVSDFELHVDKYGYTFRPETAIDSMYEDYFYMTFLRKSKIPDEFGPNTVVDWIGKGRVKNLLMQDARYTDEHKFKKYKKVWVHPSGDYDYIDMTEWAGTFASNRVKTLGRPEMASGWMMPWYSLIGKDLKSVYTGNPDMVTKEESQVYFDFVNEYKKKKLQNI